MPPTAGSRRHARRSPILLDLLADGTVKLTTICLLAPHLTPENHRELLEAARHKSKRDVERQIAALDPKPPVPSTIRKLPVAKTQRDLSVSWERIGDVRRAQGDLSGALRAYEDGHAIREWLAAVDPGNMKWQRDLSFSLTLIAGCYEQLGNRTEALRFALGSLRIDEHLASLDPSNTTWQKDLAVSRAQVARLRE